MRKLRRREAEASVTSACKGRAGSQLQAGSVQVPKLRVHVISPEFGGIFIALKRQRDPSVAHG